jgi:hypothetical protein
LVLRNSRAGNAEVSSENMLRITTTTSTILMYLVFMMSMYINITIAIKRKGMKGKTKLAMDLWCPKYDF